MTEVRHTRQNPVTRAPSNSDAVTALKVNDDDDTIDHPANITGDDKVAGKSSRSLTRDEPKYLTQEQVT